MTPPHLLLFLLVVRRLSMSGSTQAPHYRSTRYYLPAPMGLFLTTSGRKIV